MLTEYDEEKVLRQIGQERYEDGLEKGLKEGKEEGHVEELSKNIIRVLSVKGNVDEELKKLILSIKDRDELDKMFDYAITAESLDDFKKSIM